MRALAVSPDGNSAVSGSFDTSAIRWSLARNAAEQVLRFHTDAVNAVAYLTDGRIATAGADARIAIWSAGEPEPDQVLEGHTAPIVALAVSPDGAMLASASWDHTVRLWPLAGGAPRVLEGHRQNVNGVAFTPDGRALVSASYDLTLRIWPLTGAASETIVTLPTPLNAVAVAPDGEIVAGGADGKVYFLNAAGDARRRSRRRGPTPVIALAISPDGALVAAAGIRGSVAIIERKTRSLARTLVGPGLPVWSVAFLPDNRTLVTGGNDRLMRRWDARNGEHDRRGRDRDAGRSAGRLCRRSRRGSLSRLRRLPHADARTKATAPGRRWPASSVAASRRCRATIFRRRSRSSISCGRRRRCQSCSRSARPPTRPAPRCRSRASARRKTARR